MESTAQYWKPVWEAQERYWKPIREKREGARRKSGTLHLAVAQSNRGRRGTQERFPGCRTPGEAAGGPGIDSELCARCRAPFVADSYAQEVSVEVRSGTAAEPSGVSSGRGTYQIVQPRLRSAVSARRMLKALADGETSPTALAALADERLRATPEQLCDALGACTELNTVYPRLLKMALEELRLIDEQIGELDKEMASLLSEHQDAVERLAEVPGLGVDSAQQIIAEVGPTAATFPSEKCLSSWVGACPGDDESAGVNYSHRSPKGNRHMRRLLNQAANAAARTKGSIFKIVYRSSVPRLGHNQAIGAIAHRQCRLIWLILHQGVRYEERGPAVTKQSKAKAHGENDPATPKPRLSDRTTESFIQPSTSAVIFEPVGLPPILLNMSTFSGRTGTQKFHPAPIWQRGFLEPRFWPVKGTCRSMRLSGT